MQYRVEHLSTQLDQHRLADLSHQNGTHHRADGKEQRHADQSQRRQKDKRTILVVEPHIEHLAQQRSRQRGHARRAK